MIGISKHNSSTLSKFICLKCILNTQIRSSGGRKKEPLQSAALAALVSEFGCYM